MFFESQLKRFLKELQNGIRLVAKYPVSDHKAELLVSSIKPLKRITSAEELMLTFFEHFIQNRKNITDKGSYKLII